MQLRTKINTNKKKYKNKYKYKLNKIHETGNENKNPTMQCTQYVSE